MSRIGLTPDHLAALAWPPRRYAARLGTLDLLQGETVALVGDGTRSLLEQAADKLRGCVWVEGPVAARGGVLRVHAQQAARVGLGALAITGPFETGLGHPARSLAVADLAGISDLGLTTVVEVADVELGALFADRVVVVSRGELLAAYPVIMPTPRSSDDVRAVTERATARLAAAG